MYKFCELIRQFIPYLSSKKYLNFLPEILVILVFCGGWYLSWQQVKGFFVVHNWSQVRLGAKVDELLPAEARIIADSKIGDTNFLFQTRRTGWPDSVDLDGYIAQGAQYLVATDTDDFYHYLLDHYQLFYQDEDGYIFDLGKPLDATVSSIIE